MYLPRMATHNGVSLEDIYDKAISHLETMVKSTLDIPNFDHKFWLTGHEMGDLYESAYIEYAREYEFTAGKLLNYDLKGVGWVELSMHPDDEEPTMCALFGMYLEIDGNRVEILREKAIHCYYDFDSQTWSQYIDTY